MYNDSPGGNGETSSKKTAYDFSFNTLIENKPLLLSDFKGCVILIVNTASKCLFTSQYEDLEKLYQHYKNKGFVIIGVPSNDFAGQEPGSNKEIANFCKLDYGVAFPITSKEKVLGRGAHPFYLWAKKVLGFGTAPKWNFHKYLISRQGEIIDYFYSTTSPRSARLIKSIENALSKNTGTEYL